jgi:Cu(I)/Ag(I) efflux system protein CusF
MKTLKSFSIMLALPISLWLSADARAQEIAPEAKMPLVDTSAEMTEGEIRKIDRANKKITIKHGEIKNLDMPGMTMVFQVKDPVMLDTVKVGDKVRFRVEKEGGAFVITNIQKGK